MLNNKNNVVEFTGSKTTDNTLLITANDVRQQIDLLNKAEGSIKNIKSGFNGMIKAGLIQEHRIRYQFGQDGFPSLLLDVRSWVASHKKNKQWPSFLNDIRQAVSTFNYPLSDDSSFSETIRFFAHHKFGAGLSDEKIIEALISSPERPKNLLKRDLASSYRFWLKDKAKLCSEMSARKIEYLDNVLNARGVISEKGNFLLSLPIRSTSEQTKERFPQLSQRLKEEIEAYGDWKLHSKRPDEPQQYKTLQSRQKMKYRANNHSPWTLNSDQVCLALEGFKKRMKACQACAKDIGKDTEFKIIDIFDVDFLDAYMEWYTQKGVSAQAEATLDWIISECNENTFVSHYLIPDRFDTYADWIDELHFVKDVAKEYLKKSKDNREELDGKRNVRFILDSDEPWDEYYKVLSEIRKIANLRGNSLHYQAAHLMFKWMIYCPLRVRNVTMLKWLGDCDHEDLSKFETSKAIGIYRFKETGEFGVFVHKSHLKNKRSKRVESIRQVFHGMKRDFEKYLRIRQGELNRLNIETDYWLFTTSNSHRSSLPGKKVATQTVYTYLSEVTKQALHAVYPDKYYRGINPHGMRHLSATLYLDDNPENYTGLSTLLMDNLETVIAVYAKVNNKANAARISKWAKGRMSDAK